MTRLRRPRPQTVIDALLLATVAALLLVPTLAPLASDARTRDAVPAAAAIGVLAVLGWRHHARLRRETRGRANAEAERDRIALQLDEARRQLRSLQSVPTMCACCKSVRDAAGDWKVLEVYLEEQLRAIFTHAVCPECMRVEYPDLFQPR